MNQTVTVLFKKSRRVHDSKYSMIEVKIIKGEKAVRETLVDLIQIGATGDNKPFSNLDCQRDGWFRIWDIKDAKITGSVLTITPRSKSR